jgi:hypothetical protein
VIEIEIVPTLKPTRTPVGGRTMTPPRLLCSFPTERRAITWARRFDYARACNGLPPLIVAPLDGAFAVYNPAPDQPAGPFRLPPSTPPA